MWIKEKEIKIKAQIKENKVSACYNDSHRKSCTVWIKSPCEQAIRDRNKIREVHLSQEPAALPRAEEICLWKREQQGLRLCDKKDRVHPQDSKKSWPVVNSRIIERLYSEGNERYEMISKKRNDMTWIAFVFFFSIIFYIFGMITNLQKSCNYRKETFFWSYLNVIWWPDVLLPQVYLLCIFYKQDILLCNHNTTSRIRKWILTHYYQPILKTNFHQLSQQCLYSEKIIQNPTKSCNLVDLSH